MEEDNKEIKVGDIVKFNEHAWRLKDKDGHLERTSLSGALGLVINSDYWLNVKIIIDKHHTSVITDHFHFEVLSDEQIAYIKLSDYFSEEDLKKYRGDRNNEPPVKAIEEDEIKRLKQFLTEHGKDLRVMIDGVYCGSISTDDNIEEEIKRLEGIMKNSKKKQEALSYQVGGSHYKDKAIQPVEYIVANKLDFLEGCIVKRITRHREKLGALDICKIRQECDLILQLEYDTTFEEVMEKEK